jgi:hypothetical protein
MGDLEFLWPTNIAGRAAVSGGSKPKIGRAGGGAAPYMTTAPARNRLQGPRP